MSPTSNTSSPDDSVVVSNVIWYYRSINGVMKMFEIKKPTSSNKTIRMPDNLIEKLERLAAKHDISFNQLVVQCCEYALENLGKENTGK